MIRDGVVPDPNELPFRMPVYDGATGAVVNVGDACGEVVNPEGRSDLGPRQFDRWQPQ
jgi:hypothetical protein